jgi:hypothetical protein
VSKEVLETVSGESIQAVLEAAERSTDLEVIEVIRQMAIKRGVLGICSFDTVGCITECVLAAQTKYLE